MKYTTLALVLLAAACGREDSQTPAQDGGIDAVTDAPADTPSSPCTGDCATTAVTATFDSTATLNVAFYGVSPSDSTYYIEVNLGGDGSCPEESSPTPTYSLVMGSVAFPVSSTPYNAAGAMFDFSPNGDLHGMFQPATTQDIVLTPVAVIDPLTPDGTLAFDIAATFTQGSAVGHFYATHCASMDE